MGQVYKSLLAILLLVPLAMQGSLISVSVNGVTTAVLKDADPTPGFIALQHRESGTIKFRNVELRRY